MSVSPRSARITSPTGRPSATRQRCSERPEASSVAVLVGMSLLFGFANGFSGFANQAALYIQAPAAEIAVASGLYRTFAYIGAIFSASLIDITLGSATNDGGFHVLGWVLGGLGILVLLLAALDSSIPVVTDK